MRRFVVLLVLAGVLGFLPTTPVVRAQEGPPALGPVVAEDALIGPGMLRAGVCPTQRNAADFADGGLRIKVTGKCRDTSTTAVMGRTVEGVALPDGEIRVEFRVTSGANRASVRLWVREQGNNDDGYFATLIPATGTARLTKRANGQVTRLIERSDLTETLSTTHWLALAVRAEGAKLWVLVNDQPVLSAEDPTYDQGRVLIDLARSGDPTDEWEISVDLRNLRVSGLSSGEQARLPTYLPPPSPATTAAPAPAAPVVSGDPSIGNLRFSYDISGGGAVPPGSTLTRQEHGTIYYFFEWHNLTPGAKLTMTSFHGKEVRLVTEHVVTRPRGNYRGRLISYDGLPDGGWRYTSADASVEIALNGQQLARGYILLE